MRTNDTGGIYTVIAGDPKEEDENKIFISQGNTFEEADNLFTSLLAKREYPVIMLDEGDITIRGFKAPDRDEWDQKYTLLKEDLYRKSNPDKKPLYAICVYKNDNQDSPNTNIPRTVHKLLESDDFDTAFSSYIDFVDRFIGKNIPYDGIRLIDTNSLRLLDTTKIVRQNPEETIKPTRKKPEEPGYDR